MPRKNLLRRFEPRYGVSAAMIEAEARSLAREAEDHELLSASELETTRSERRDACRQSWKHLCLLLDGLPERDRRTVHCLLYRDMYHILELYLAHLRGKRPEGGAPTSVASPSAPADPLTSGYSISNRERRNPWNGRRY